MGQPRTSRRRPRRFRSCRVSAIQYTLDLVKSQIHAIFNNCASPRLESCLYCPADCPSSRLWPGRQGTITYQQLRSDLDGEPFENAVRQAGLRGTAVAELERGLVDEFLASNSLPSLSDLAPPERNCVKAEIRNEGITGVYSMVADDVRPFLLFLILSLPSFWYSS